MGVGQSEVSAVTHRMIGLGFAVPTALAIVLGIVLALGGASLARYLGQVDQAKATPSVTGSRATAELPNSDARLTRVHMLLSNMK